MQLRPSSVRFASTLVSALVVALAAGSAIAQTTYTWDGGGGDNLWSTGANWGGDTAPVRGNSTSVTFAGSSRLSPFNDQGDWQQIAGMTFASGASGFRIEGNNIGFVNAGGEQFINQNSATTQEINATFSFGPNQNSRINLNAGDLLVSSPNLYIDSASSVRNLTVTGNDSTRRTVTFSGNVNKGGTAADPDMYIQNNKRALVTGALTFGSGNDGSIFIGSGVLQFSGAGTMTGGRPVIGSGGGSDSAALWLDTAGTTFARQLEMSDGSQRRTIGGLNTSGTVTFSGDFAGSASNYDLAAATGGAAVFSGVRNFSGGLYVNRPEGASTYGGTVHLAGTTNSDSFTAIHAGTLQFSDFNQLGSAHVEFNADSGDSGTLRYTGGSTTTTKTLWIDNNGITRAAIDVSQAGTTLTWNPGNGAVNQNLTKTGAGTLQFGLGISGAATVGVEAGTLILTGSSSYSGGTVVSSGTVEVSAGGAAGGNAAALGTGTVSIASGAQVTYWLSESGAHTIANAVSLSGGTLHTADGVNTFSGPVALASGASTISGRWEDTITLSGGLAGSGNVLFTQGGGGTDKAAPTFVLSGVGANTGTVRVSGSSGGQVTRLQLANVNALQSATLDLATGDVGAVEFTVAGNNTYALGGLQGSRNLAFGANSLSIGGNGQSTTYAGNLSGSGLVTKVGSGTVTLSGNNTNSGGVALDAGVLALGSAGALGSSGTISFGGGTLRSSAGNTTDYSGRFSTAAGQQYRIDTNGQNVTLAANLASAGGSLTKLGTGTLVLSGSNSYGGGTTVSAGRLAVNGQLGNTAVTVQDGAELGGSGRIAGTVLVAAGGTLAPGNSIESLGAGATTFSGSSTFAYEYDSSAAPAVRGDLFVVSGNLSIASGALISFADLAGASQPFVFGTSLAMINYTGSWDGGYFTYGGVELTNGAEFMVGSQQWQIEYNRASPAGLANFAADYQPGSRFVIITAVPEPSAVVLGIFGLVLGAGLFRRRTTGRSRAACRG